MFFDFLLSKYYTKKEIDSKFIEIKKLIDQLEFKTAYNISNETNARRCGDETIHYEVEKTFNDVKRLIEEKSKA